MWTDFDKKLIPTSDLAKDNTYHYNDVIMGAIASQITSLTIVYSIVIQTQIKENIKAPRHWPLCGEFTCHRWIPRTNGQLCGKCFHLMMSSCGARCKNTEQYNTKQPMGTALSAANKNNTMCYNMLVNNLQRRLSCWRICMSPFDEIFDLISCAAFPFQQKKIRCCRRRKLS